MLCSPSTPPRPGPVRSPAGAVPQRSCAPCRAPRAARSPVCPCVRTSMCPCARVRALPAGRTPPPLPPPPLELCNRRKSSGAAVGAASRGSLRVSPYRCAVPGAPLLGAVSPFPLTPMHSPKGQKGRSPGVPEAGGGGRVPVLRYSLSPIPKVRGQGAALTPFLCLQGTTKKCLPRPTPRTSAGASPPAVAAVVAAWGWGLGGHLLAPHTSPLCSWGLSDFVP